MNTKDTFSFDEELKSLIATNKSMVSCDVTRLFTLQVYH